MRQSGLIPTTSLPLLTGALLILNKATPTEPSPIFNGALRSDPYNARALYGRGMLYSKMDNYDKAIADFSESIRLDPQNSARPVYSRAWLIRKWMTTTKPSPITAK